MKTPSRISALFIASLGACDGPVEPGARDDEPAGARIGPLEANCLGVEFGDECINDLTIEDVIDFGAEGATLLDHGSCEDEDGDAIADCLWILVDQGPGLERVQYWLVPSTTGCSLPTTECFAEYRSPLRAVHEVDYALLPDGFYLGTKTRYELAQTKQVGQAMVSSWKPGNTIELTQSYAGWGEATATMCQGIRVRAPDGVRLMQDALCTDAIASSGSLEMSAEVACGYVEEAHRADTTSKTVWWTGMLELMIPDSFQATMSQKFDQLLGLKGAADKLEGSAGGGSEFSNTVVVTNSQPTAFMTSAVLAGEAAGKFAYIDCLNDPHKYFPNRFDAPDAANPPVAPPAQTWVDQDAAVDCDALGFTQIEEVEYSKNGQHCGANASVSYTCSDGLGGSCECTGTPDLTRVTDEVCTT